MPVCGHLDEIEEFHPGKHHIEPWNLYIVRLDARATSDMFLNADVTPVFGRSYLRYKELAAEMVDHHVSHFVRPSQLPVVGNCHISVLVGDLIARDLDDPVLKDESVLRKFIKAVLMRISVILQQRFADRIVATMISGSEEALAVGGKIAPLFQEFEWLMSSLRRYVTCTDDPDGGTDAFFCLD